jgi:hypothetical protein
MVLIDEQVAGTDLVSLTESPRVSTKRTQATFSESSKYASPKDGVAGAGGGECSRDRRHFADFLDPLPTSMRLPALAKAATRSAGGQQETELPEDECHTIASHTS